MMMKKRKLTTAQGPKESLLSRLKLQAGYYVMILPAVLCLLLFNYAPMAGLYMGFTDYKPAKGIFGSRFIGLTHFKQFFTSIDFVRVFRNTLLYSASRIVIVNLLTGIVFALLLYEIRSRLANKVYHTCMLLPSFIAWTVISGALLILLHPDNGLVNDFLKNLGLQTVS